MGSCTYPPPPKGLSDCNLERNGDDEELVLTGTSGSLRDQPNELTESRKEVEVMVALSRFPIDPVTVQLEERLDLSVGTTTSTA